MSDLSINSLDEISMNTSASVSVVSAESERNASVDLSSPISMIQLIQDFMLNNKKLDDNTLSPEGMQTINILLKHELNMLNEIDKHLTNILKNGKLDASDIPDLILLIKTVCNMYSPKLKKLKITKGELIKFIHDILIIVVKSDLTPMQNKDLCIKMIDTSTSLLETSIELEETMSCCCLPRKKK